MYYLDRRDYLRSCIGVIPLLGGCISLTKYDGYADIVLDNASDIDYQVTIQLSGSNSWDRVFEETYDVEAEGRIFEEEIVEEGVYDIRATIGSRSNSEAEFELACEDDRDEDDDEVTLAILLNDNYSISISKVCESERETATLQQSLR